MPSHYQHQEIDRREVGNPTWGNGVSDKLSESVRSVTAGGQVQFLGSLQKPGFHLNIITMGLNRFDLACGNCVAGRQPK